MLPPKVGDPVPLKLYAGHYQAYLERIRQAHPNAIAFVNPPIFAEPPNLPEDLKRGRVALSSHFYDGITMLGKRKLQLSLSPLYTS